MSDVSDTREAHAHSIAGKMDGVVKKAGSAIAGTKRPESPPPVPNNADSPLVATSKRPDKHSMDYMVRSGIAGGIAGCAVCFSHSIGLGISVKTRATDFY